MTETIAEMWAALADEPRIGLRAGDAVLSWGEAVGRAAQRGTWMSEFRRAERPYHVGTLLENTVEHVLWLGAAAMAGAVVVGGNTTHRGGDLARDLAHTECQMLVTDSARLALVDGLHLGDAIGHVSRDNPRVLVVDEPRYEEELAAFAGARVADLRCGEVRPGDLGYLLFTSGTSGAPKACRCTQGRLAFIGTVLAERYGLGPQDCCYLSMPLFHSNALMAGWAPALAGGAAMALPTGGRFSASGFLSDVRRNGVTYFNYVGKPLAYILATPEKPDDADNPLRDVFGNEGSPRDVDRFAKRFGCAVSDNYGSTEGGVALSRTPDTPAGALGPAPAGLLILDPGSGSECEVATFDESGRLTNAQACIGEMVSTTGGGGFEGYWDNDEAEKARLRDGWYWTGDLAYKDGGGFVYFAGRADDWLRVDGENFAAAPVARLIERHPDVVLATVYAVPDPVVGDQVMATVQLHPEANFDGEEFAEFLVRQPDLGTKWSPRFVRVCEKLPTTATSKVLVRALRAEAWHCDDPVYLRDGRGPKSPYRLMTKADVAKLDSELGAAPGRNNADN